MPAHRFFLNSPLTHSTLSLSEEELHHLKHVMRARPGDTVEIVNGKGTLVQARLLDATHLEITHRHQEPPPSRTLVLAQALTRPALLDWIIEKGTELGATHFWLFPGELSDKKELSPHQLERLSTLLISALKQCGRLYLPTLEIKPRLLLWQRPPGTLLYGSFAPGAKPLQPHAPSPVIIFIGPEKGLSNGEESFLENKLHASPVTLHPNILRAETAALCALSVLSQQSMY